MYNNDTFSVKSRIQYVSMLSCSNVLQLGLDIIRQHPLDDAVVFKSSAR